MMMQRDIYSLFLFALLTLTFSLSAFSSDDKGIKLDYKVEDTHLIYGDYAEIEFSVKSNKEFEFSLQDDVYPVGMILDQMSSNSFVLVGAPEFVDKFCFLVKVTKKEKKKDFLKRICLYGEKNTELEYPKFKSSRDIKDATKGEFSKVRITLDASSSSIIPEYVAGNLPEGLDVKTQSGSLEISGTPVEAGASEFVVMAHDQANDLYTYKQFILEVKAESVIVYQCDTGYYYDETVGYCVQNRGAVCSTGEFYDSNLNQCVRYVTPSHITCSPGSYYDHFLYRCVRNTYNRCPYNYEWDPYYNRCIRQPYTCSIGSRYSWSRRACVYVGFRQCSIGSYYSSYYSRCIRRTNYCRAGHYWNGNNCRYTSRVCRGNRYFDPRRSACRRYTAYRTCRGGMFYNYNSNRCVRRVVNRSCRRGSRYSNGRCVAYRSVQNRPRPTRRPTARPNRPTTRPNRPTTRPNRPTTRPNRPTTRPSTRPSRPSTRPSRPSTRPSRGGSSRGSSSRRRPGRGE